MKEKLGNIEYRPDLGMMVMEFYEDQITEFIGLQVMPLTPTPDKQGTFLVTPKEAMLKVYDTSRAPRGSYKRDDFEYERGLYDTVEQGWEEPVDDSERSRVDRLIPRLADDLATQRAMSIIMRAQEKRIADLLFNETNFTAHSVTTEWNTAASATPLDDVLDGIASFRSQCGMKPDVLIISYTTFLNLKACDQIVDQIKYTFPGIDILAMGANQLAQLFGVPRVLVAGGVYDSKGKGIDTTIADIWSSEYAMLVKIPRTADEREPCVGRTWLWTEDSPSNAIVEKYREEQKRSDIFRVRHNTDERLIQSFDNTKTVRSNIAAACGYLMKNIHT